MSYDGEGHEDDCRCDACMKYADPGEPAAEVARLTAQLEEARGVVRALTQLAVEAFDDPQLYAPVRRGQALLAASSCVPGQERSRGTHAEEER